MKTLALILAAAGLLALGYCAFEFAGARLFQAREAQRFAMQSRPEPAVPSPEEAPPAPDLEPYPKTGSPVALLAIPRLGLSTLVVEGADRRELKLAPGHISGTALPGAGGNFAVAGHRDTFFRPLRRIVVSDSIVVTTQSREYHYRVAATRIVGPRDVHVLRPSDHETLTLVTCYPFQFIGAAPERFIVRADCLDCQIP